MKKTCVLIDILIFFKRLNNMKLSHSLKSSIIVPALFSLIWNIGR
jgi:hypothetical protein